MVERVREKSALQRLQEISVKILGQLELDPLLEWIVSSVADLLEAALGSLYLYDPQRNELRPRAPLHLPEGMEGVVYKRGEGMAGKVLLTGQPMRVDDYDSWEGRHPQIAYGLGGPIIQVPLKRGEEFLGVLEAFRSPGAKPFTDEDVELLQLFANQGAVAIANAQLYEETKRSAEQLSSLYETSLEITRQLDPSKVLEGIIQRAVQLLHGDYGQFYLFDETSQELIPSVPYQLPEPLQKIILKPGEGLSGKVLTTHQPLIVNDYDSWEGKSPSVPAGIAQRAIGAPVEHGDKVLGVLAINRKREDPPFTEGDVRLLTLFANQAAVAIANARLYEEARRSAQKLSSLHETAVEMASQLELEPLLHFIVTNVVALLDADYGNLYRYDAEHNELHTWVQIGFAEDLGQMIFKPGEGAAGKVLLTGQPIKLDDYDTWEGRSPQIPLGLLGAGMGVPIRRGGEFLGVLTVGRARGKKPVTDEEVALLQLFANQAAVAITNARLYEETRRSAQELSRLYETSIDITRQLELDPLLESILSRVVELLEAGSGELYFYDPQRDELHPKVPLHLPREVMDLVLKRGEGLAGKVLATGNPIKVDDYDTWEGRAPQWPYGIVGPSIGAPIQRGQEFLGVLIAARDPGKTPFSDEDIYLLQLFANQAAVAIANARLYAETKRSAQELTRLYETSIDITRQLTVPKLLEAIMFRAADLLSGSGGIFFLFNPSTGKLHPEGMYRRRADFPQSPLAPGEGLAGKIFVARQPMAVEDYDTWEGRSPGYIGKGLARLGGAPMLLGDKCLGVIIVDRKREDPLFSEDDLRLLSLFANQAAVALTNAQLYQEAQQRAGELSSLYESSLEMASQLEPQKLLEAIVLRAERLLGGGFAEIDLYDPQRKELRSAAGHSTIPEPYYEKLAVKPGEGLDGTVFDTGQPMIVGDYNTWEGRAPNAPPTAFPRIAAVPIRLGKEILGSLKVGRKAEDPLFSDDDLRLLTLFGSQAAVAIANARLYAETRKNAEQLHSLYDASLEMASQLDPQKLLEAIALRAWRLLQAKVTEIYLYDLQRQGLWNVVRVSRGQIRPPYEEELTKPGEGIDGRVFATGQPMIIEDYNAWEGRIPGWPPLQAPRMATVPIRLGAQTLGTIKVRRMIEDPTYTEDDVRLLTLFANQAAVALDNAQKYEELQKLYSQVQDKERLESELRVAHNIQASLLPQELPKIRGWEVEALWVPARTISGDFYDVFPVPGGKWGMVIADVAGKGVPAALFMALCRTLVRTFCMDGRPPREAIARANDLILADAKTDWFVTLFYGLLDPKWGIFSYVNAGHPPPLWYRHGQEKIEGLRAEGMALGILSEIKLEEKSVQLEPGDLVLFYTDGLSEAADPQDRLFGVNRLRALFRALADSGPLDILQNLQKAIAAFAQGREVSDDITAVLLKRGRRR